ncbi:MAG: NAD-dependent dehydratase [Bacteroidetes bacterium GWE2_29_8]|nr:MAG: NAD-dependent dehydratase [Bacteroidetes bacterium GWE2_29_8]
MKKILITGASGFIGSFLVEEALSQGYIVYAGIRRSSSKDYLTNTDINFIELNFSNKNVLKEKLTYYKNEIGQFDYIIHNAGITKSNNKRDFEKVNYQNTKNFIEALIETNTTPEKFIYISSLAAYGPGNEQTMLPVTETDTPNPITLYGKSKLNAELFIKSLNNFPYLIFRPTGVYGPREKDYFVMYKMINQHMETYIGTPYQNITFIYVKDLVHLIINATMSSITQKSYFVTDGNKYTTKEFSEIVKQKLNKRTIQLVFPKQIVKPIAYFLENIFAIIGKTPTLNSEKYKEISCKNWLCDSNAIVNDFGFKAKYDLKKGIEETIEWCKTNKWL